MLRIVEAAPELRVAASAASGAEFLSLLPTTHIDVCLLDLSLPDADGMDLIPRIQALSPDTRILIFTMHAETAFGVSCMKAGAAGFLTKGAAPSELRDAIRSVHRGTQALTPELAQLLAQPASHDVLPHVALSPREWAVFLRLAQGLRNADISRELQLDQRTVSSYRRRVLDKMHLQSDTDLALYAAAHGLVEQSAPAPTLLANVRSSIGGGLTPEMIAMWERLAEGLPLSVIVTDAAGIVTNWSSHATALFGYRRDEAIGTPIMALTVLPDSSEIAASIMDRLGAGEMWDGEFRARRKDGSPVDVHVFDIPVYESNGTFAGVCGLSIDVSVERGELQDALSRNRELFDRTQQAREAERSRIAADIHDDIGQHLTSLRTLLLGLQEEATPDPAHVAQTLSTAIGEVDSVLSEVRRICAQLRPPLLEQLGLGESLRSLCLLTAARTGMTFTIEVDSYRGSLDAKAELELYRMAQETLTNIERHAGASRVALYLADEVDEQGTQVVLEVDDDGIGFDVASLDLGRTIGVGLLHERARRINATLSIVSSKEDNSPGGRGTLVRVETPVTA
mgnify:CR=1 FL=1